MITIKILASLIPIPLFYLLYYRYFIYKPEYIKHVESFLYGVALALIILLLAPMVNFGDSGTNLFVLSFFKAAFVEKLGAFVFIYFIHKNYPNFSIMESIISAMLLGLGFAGVENIFYSINYGTSVILLRIITSVPLHMTTTGIIGFYLGLAKTSGTGFYKKKYMFQALFIPILLHGLFDLFLNSGGKVEFLIIPTLIIIVIILELLIARTVTILPAEVLEAMNLRFEDWLTINRQPRYDRWIYRSSGISKGEKVPLLKWNADIKKILLIIFFISLSLLMFRFSNQIQFISNFHYSIIERMLIFVVFPFSIAVIIFIIGIFNPEFIDSSIIKIPIITDVTVKMPNLQSETFVTYDITPANCFLKTFEPLGINSEMTIRFDCPGFSSHAIKGKVIWENHENEKAAMGTIIKISDLSFSFRRFLFKYIVFKFKRGFAFIFKLPGFEKTKRFFMRPISTIKKDQAFKTGDTVYKEGDMGNRYYLLKKGYILLYKSTEFGEDILIDSINPGEIFGEIAILKDSPRNTTAYCASDCVVGVAHKDDLDALVINNPDFALSMLETLANRLYKSEKILIDKMKDIENQHREGKRLLHVAMMLTLFSLKGSNPNLNITLDKIELLLKNLDNDVAAQLISLVAEKSSLTDKESLSEIDKKIEKRLGAIFKDLPLKT